MATAHDDRAVAERVLSRLYSGTISEESLALASEATAYALLAVGARLAELVEQQRLSNVIAALGTTDEETLIDDDTLLDAERYVRNSVADIVNPLPGGDPR
ncbi:hypothetical protein ACIBCD_27065 [Nocardia brasiliensis]|uniref:hypothetical protein n=1 Tax=Nocardia brasiliensis TaxID=37326 RepID=UPI003795F79D